MTGRAIHFQSVLTRTTTPLLATVVFLATVTPFISWNANSLWGDELFSLYFSDPALTPRDVLFRSLEDVHPPTYYLLLYGLRRLIDADPVLVGRWFSAACAAASLFVLWLATKRILSTQARLLMLVSASLSLPYFGQSVEIRSYAFDFLLVALMIAFALHWTAPDAKRPRWQPGVFILFLIAATTVHYYLVFVAAAILAFLVANARDRVEASMWAAGGLAVAAFSKLFLNWHQNFIVPDLALDGPANLSIMSELKLGLIMIARSPILIALALASPLVISWSSIIGRLQADLRSIPKEPMFLALVGSIGTLAAALIFTLFIDPVFAARLFTIVMPFVWIGCGILFQVALTRDKFGIFLVIFLFASLWSAGRLLDHFSQRNPDYRAASAALKSQSACLTDAIAVTGYRQKFIGGDEATVFYGHYLPPSPNLHKVPLGRPLDEIAADTIRVVGGPGRISTRECSTLLWSARGLNTSQMNDVATIIESSAAFPERCRIYVREYETDAITSVTALPPPLGARKVRQNGDMVQLYLRCEDSMLTERRAQPAGFAK